MFQETHFSKRSWAENGHQTVPVLWMETEKNSDDSGDQKLAMVFFIAHSSPLKTYFTYVVCYCLTWAIHMEKFFV